MNNKIELNDIQSGYQLSKINDNFRKIEDELNHKVLYRDNPVDEANHMMSNIDMNGFSLLNTNIIVRADQVSTVPYGPLQAVNVQDALNELADEIAAGGGGGTGGSGEPGVPGISTGLMYAYQRSATPLTSNPGAVVYDYALAKITSPATNELANGWTQRIPAGTDPLYVVAASAAGTASTDTVLPEEWTAPVILARDGLAGLNTATVYIYKRSATPAAPALPTVAATYVYNPPLVSNLNNGWTNYVPDASGGPYLFVTTATAASTSNTDSIAATEWAPAQLLSKDGIDAVGSTGTAGTSNATFFAYKRVAGAAPIDNPGTVTYSFIDARIVTPSGDALANGWTKTIPSGSDNLYIVAATASGINATDDVLAVEWTSPTLLSMSGVNGTNGLNVASIYIYQRGNTLPVKPSTASTYTFATGVVAGMNNGWSATIPPEDGSANLYVCTATASALTATDTIPSTEWSDVTVLAKNGQNGINGTVGRDGVDGKRGTVTLAVATTGASFDTTAAMNAILNATGTAPVNRDIVTMYNSSVAYSETKFYDNGSWIAMTAYINGNMLVNGTLSANKITASSFSGYTFTGSIFQTASSGQRVVINGSGDNRLRAYNSAGSLIAEIGGTNGNIYATGANTYPTIYGYNESNLPGISGGVASGGLMSAGVYGTGAPSGTSYGVYGVINNYSGAGGYFKNNAADGAALLVEGRINTTARPSGQGTLTSNSVIPLSNNTYTCGFSSYAWSAIYSTTAVVVTSDVRTKTDIKDSDLGLDFIKTLRPVSYRLKVGENEVIEGFLDENGEPTTELLERPGKRIHYGFIAQEVKEALGDKDSAIWALTDKNDPDSIQMLRVEELISPAIKAIQELTAKVEALEAQLKALT